MAKHIGFHRVRDRFWPTATGVALLLLCFATQAVAGSSHTHAVPAASALPPEQSPPAAAFDATAIGSPLALDKDWRVGLATDLAPADPRFDDSKWLVYKNGDSLESLTEAAAQHRPGPRPFFWYRLRVRLRPGHGPVALLIQLPVTQTTNMTINAAGLGTEVYAQGRPVTPDGPHANDPNRYQEISRLYRLHIPPEQTELLISWRTLSLVPRTAWLGDPDDLSHMLELWAVHSFFERLPRATNSVLLAFLSMFLLALYFTQRGHREYLWLAIHELLQAPIGFIDMAGSSAHIDQLWYAAAMIQLLFISAYLYFEFLIAFLSLRRRWYISGLRYTAPILAATGPVLMLVGHSDFTGVILAVVYIISLLWLLCWIIFIFSTLIIATLKRNFEAGLLLVPLVLTMVSLLPNVVMGGTTEFSGNRVIAPLTIQAGPVPIHFAAIADFAGLLTIVLIIFGRFLRIQHDRERANSELAAARSVQELMIPHEKLETPGYEIDSVYTPANEVGGDFFYVQPAPDGSMLIVIGDVAGKGLKAAMNVSMLMGALRRTTESSPARILESLNRVLAGSESLTTCQAIWFGPSGELTMASAGHLPPYLNSQEVAVPGGLPLGALPEIVYDEIRLYLHPGDRLLLLSDGVVEARQPSGELFGFDRVHNLSNQSAFYIADAAKSFGQEDDITVLTVRRLTQAMAA